MKQNRKYREAQNMKIGSTLCKQKKPFKNECKTNQHQYQSINQDIM